MAFNSSIFFGIANLAAIIVGGAAFLFITAKRGVNTASNEAISTFQANNEAYKIRVDQLTKENADLRAEQNLSRQEIGRLQGTITEMNKRIQEMSLVLQNRNPEFDGLPKKIDHLILTTDRMLKVINDLDTTAVTKKLHESN